MHFALIPVQLPSEDFEQGSLAGAVLAQQAHPLPLVYLKGQAVQYLLPTSNSLDRFETEISIICLLLLSVVI